MADTKLLAGLDIGTTSCKISIFDPSGTYLGSASREYPAERTSSAHEIDPVLLREAVFSVISEVAKRFPGIAGIGITSFGETFVLLDRHGNPLLPAMLYTDPRGSEETALLSGLLGEERIIHITGVAPSPMYSLPKLMYVKSHMPEVFEKTARICLMEDYIVGTLTGNWQIDYSLAARTMAFDIHSLTWSQDMLDAAGINARLLSTPVPTGTAAGRIHPALAGDLGLPRDTVIVSISHDQVAAAVGSGVLDAEYTVDGAGTVECLTPVFSAYDEAGMAKNNYCIVPFLNGQYVTYAFSYTGGALICWFTTQLAGYASAEAKAVGKSVYDLLEGAPDGQPTGLLVLPHFAGAATPYMDGGSRGAILGLTLSHTEQDIYRALMEGVCYEMRLNQEHLLKSGISLSPLRATGGGARSRVWLQMKADILGVPVTALETPEAGAAGSAMFVGTALGVFPSIEAAAAQMITERETFLPRPDAASRYDEVYARYRRVYDAVRPLV